MIQIGFLKEETDDIVYAELGGYPKGWSYESIRNAYQIAARQLDDNKGKLSGAWDVLFCEQCRIIQQERNRKIKIESDKLRPKQ